MQEQIVDVGSTPAAGLETATRYDQSTMLLHWLTAGLVVLLWGIAQVIDFFPKGPPRIAARSTHILLGVVLGAVLLTRIFWRIGSGRRLPLAFPGFIGYAGKAMHYVLYLLLATVVALGLANVWVRGDTITGLFTVPKFAPDNIELKKTVEGLHKTFANAILIFAGLHALAGLIHHFVLRNDVLRRMLPGKGNPGR
jgi:cytochrome b561